MEKEIKKQKIQKLQKKLENRQLSLYEVLQEDIAVDWFKMAHPAVLAMLNASAMIEIFGYIAKPGPPDNKIRSYKIPMIATQILITPTPKVFQLCFLEDEQSKGGVVVGRLMNYFDGQPNYVISGYIVKILNNLMIGNAHRVMDFLMKTNLPNMLKFLQSHSIAEFLLRIIIVEDILINSHIKERLQLYHSIIEIYSANQQPIEVLQNVEYILQESVVRLWTQKHKQLGRFSTSLFKIVELVIDNNNLFCQQNLVLVLMKHLTLYSNEAPNLIIALFKKIYKDMLLSQHPEITKNQAKQSIPKFSLKNHKLLQTINYIFTNNPDSIVKVISTSNIFTFLLDFPLKYEWNSMVLVEVEKILKATFHTSNQTIYYALFNQAYFPEKIKEYIRKENQGGKFGRGYSGFLTNILKSLDYSITHSTPFGELVKKNNPDLHDIIDKYLKQKHQLQNQIAANSYKVVHDTAKPYYNIPKLLQQFKNFFDEAQVINKDYQQERPLGPQKHKKQDVLHEIEKENELVYKLLTQVNETPGEEKKIENIGQNGNQ